MIPRKSCLETKPRFRGESWLGYLDSNQDPQLQRLVCCHCTIPQCGRDFTTGFYFLSSEIKPRFLASSKEITLALAGLLPCASAA